MKKRNGRESRGLKNFNLQLKRIEITALIILALLLLYPVFASAQTTTPSLVDLNTDIALCLTPSSSATPEQTQQACKNLIVALLAIIANLPPQPPTPPPTAPITVTAPNGGEEWEIGTLNTVTWAPYNGSTTNPAKDVEVNLVKRMTTCTTGEECDWFSVVGRVMDTGKASLHTYFNLGNYQQWAEPGEYYVQIYNKKTDSMDYSDAPFTLLPRAVDLKVDGSDTRIDVRSDQVVIVSLVTSPDVSTCTVIGVRSAEGGNGPVQLGPPINSSPTAFEAYVTADSNSAIYANCQMKDGSYRADSVLVNMTVAKSDIEVVSPNGGESVDPSNALSVSVHIAGLKTLSLALYKDDQWLTWLFKDISTAGHPDDFVWTHSHTPMGQIYSELSNGSPAVYKIYATGLKADGTGYVDDKSDAPFSFATTTQACYERTVCSPQSGGARSGLVDCKTELVCPVSDASSNSSKPRTEPQANLATVLTGLENALKRIISIVDSL